MLHGREYTGVDLRPEQVAANEAEATEMLPRLAPDHAPQWVVGDSTECLPGMGGEYDMLLTCPPYYDLEQYSEDPADLSNCPTYGEFATMHARVIRAAVERLRPDRFAVWVVGDVRGDEAVGVYHPFVEDTIGAFRAAGAPLYNRIVYVTSPGSLPIRARRYFEHTRKVGNTMQQVLVFVKGDAKRATEACGPVEVASLEGPDIEWGYDEDA